MKLFKDNFARQANAPKFQTFLPKFEEAATGVVAVEKELVYYAKLIDPSYLKDATVVEDQEQWEILIPKDEKNYCGCRMRIRKTAFPKEPARNAEYTYTVKTKNLQGSEDEVTTTSSADTFEAFKRASGRGMIKCRYVLPIEGYKAVWEIDTYKDREGNPQPWCKIDYEFVDGDPTEVPNLPTGFETIISTSAKSSEVQLFIRKLYDDVFLSKNEYLEKVADVETTDGVVEATQQDEPNEVAELPVPAATE